MLMIGKRPPNHASHRVLQPMFCRVSPRRLPKLLVYKFKKRYPVWLNILSSKEEMHFFSFFFKSKPKDTVRLNNPTSYKKLCVTTIKKGTLCANMSKKELGTVELSRFHFVVSAISLTPRRRPTMRNQ